VKVSIVMPNHNRVEALPLTLEALCFQNYPASEFEVIVVDQASTDGSRELIESYPAPFRVRLVKQAGKYGISVARNGGVEAAEGALVILLDADIVAEQELVDAHVRLHEKYAKPILGCGRLLPYRPGYKTFIDEVANPDAGLDRGVELEDFPIYYAFGGHLSFRRETFQQVGPFNPELKGAEDTEFAYRASRLGIGIKNCPEAVGYHNHFRSLEEHRKRASSYWSMTPALIEMHPELSGQIPGLAELEPLRIGREPAALSLAKARAAFWAVSLVRSGLYHYLSWAEERRALPRLTKFCYYRLMMGDQKAGARQGRITHHKSKD
jgi:GT2 family glycosyltransferase